MPDQPVDQVTGPVTEGSGPTGASRRRRSGPLGPVVRRFANLRIGTKILSVLLVVSTIFVSSGVIGLFTARNLAEQQGRQYRVNVIALSHMTGARSAVGEQLEAVVSHILSEPGFYRDQFEAAIARTDQRIDADIAQLRGNDLAPSTRRALEAFVNLNTLWRAGRDKAIQACHDGDRQQATSIILIGSESVVHAVKTRADAVLTDLVDAVAQGANDSRRYSEQAARMILVALVAGSCLAVTLSVVAARTISRPLTEAVTVLTGVGNGDFTQRLAVTSTDEVGQLAASLNQTLAALQSSFDGLQHLAFHDVLTSLPNRALLRERINAAVEGARPDRYLAVLLIDLDGFKEINDQHGHAVGDQLLTAVAVRIRGGARGANDVAARLGGDEFAVLLTDLENRGDATAVAHRLLVDVQRPMRVEGLAVQLLPRASVGVAVHSPGETVDELMRAADLAMYAAKARGKGVVAQYDQLGTVA